MVNTDRLCMGCMNDNGGEQVCSICGYDRAENNAEQYLSVGTWLNANRYNVGKVIEESGDGVTYIGWDNDRNAVVNIKEYFPEGIAQRSADRLTVSPAADRGLAFNKGKEEFADLFTKLLRMDDGVSILKVIDVFESGGTLYAVQSTVSGTTLKAFLIHHGGSLKWDQVKPLFMPLIATVSQLNDAGILHRGICPDNIIVGRDGKLRLTGFCIKSARVEHSEFLSQLPSGYVAPELYLENSESDATCDIYSLGAVIFRALIGNTPPDAKDRLVSDKLAIPTKITEMVPRAALVAVAGALKVDPTQRGGSAERLYKMFEAVSSNTMIIGDVKTAEKPKKKNNSSVKYTIIGIVAAALFFVIVITIAAGLLDFGDKPSSSLPVDASSSAISSSIVSSASEGYVPDTVLFEVPNLVGEMYADIYGDLQTEYSHFEFEVVGRLASDTVPRGAICKQSIDEGTKVERATKIELYISLGADKVSLPNIIGKSLESGKNALFEAGFYSDTIIFRKGFDASAEPGDIYRVAYVEDDAVIKAGNKVSINSLIVVYYRDPDTAVESSQEQSSSVDTSSESQDTSGDTASGAENTTP